MRPLRRLGKRGWLVMGEPGLQLKALLAVFVYFTTNQSIYHQREGGEKQNKALTTAISISIGPFHSRTYRLTSNL